MFNGAQNLISEMDTKLKKLRNLTKKDGPVVFLMTPFLKISSNYKGSIYRSISIQVLKKTYPPKNKKKQFPLWGVEKKSLHPQSLTARP